MRPVRWVSGALLLGLLGGLGYFLLTPTGSWALCQWAFTRVMGPDRFSVQQVKGSLLTGLELHQLRLTGFPRLPEHSDLMIRLVSVSFPLPNLHQPRVRVGNARLHLPDSEPILISGEMERGLIRLNVYSRRVDSQEVLRCFISEEDALKFSGPAGPIDLNLRGTLRRFEISGDFEIPQLNYYGFSLTDAVGALALQARPGARKDGFSGEVKIRSGLLNLKNSSIQLRPSRIFYTGQIKLPNFDLEGTAVVEKIPVRAVFKGTFRQPQLRLSSDPPFPQEQLLLMLATGKRFRSIEGVSSGEAQLPVDLVGAFLDYAAFGGSGTRLAQQLGVEGSVLVRDEGRTTGLGVKKSLTDKVGVRYGVEQTQTETGESMIYRQKVGAELDVTETDQISVEAESEMLPTEEKAAAVGKDAEPERSGKVLLKYKKKF